jgi:hypothetical protein
MRLTQMSELVRVQLLLRESVTISSNIGIHLVIFLALAVAPLILS